MTKPTSLKKYEALKSLSRDHHQCLQLCWKIREGLKTGVSNDRIKKYTDFFYTSQIRPHFRFEEKEIFSLLAEPNTIRSRAEKEHERLESLFKKDPDSETFSSIAKELKEHIKFEERELFRELQETVSEEKLQQITIKEEKILTPDPDDWEDKFWIK